MVRKVSNISVKPQGSWNLTPFHTGKKHFEDKIHRIEEWWKSKKEFRRCSTPPCAWWCVYGLYTRPLAPSRRDRRVQHFISIPWPCDHWHGSLQIVTFRLFFAVTWKARFLETCGAAFILPHIFGRVGYIQNNHERKLPDIFPIKQCEDLSGTKWANVLQAINVAGCFLYSGLAVPPSFPCDNCLEVFVCSSH